METKFLIIKGKKVSVDAFVSQQDLLEAKEIFNDKAQLEKTVKKLHRKVGRPKLSHEETKRIGVRIPLSLVQKLEKRAEEKHQKKSDIIREALQKYLAA